MSRPLNLEATLGKARLTQSARTDVIDFLAASAFTTTVRRAIYRDWCIRVGLKPRREELDDVAPPRRRLQRALPLW